MTIETFVVRATKSKFTETTSGHTASQAARLEAKLIAQGYTVEVTREIKWMPNKRDADNPAK